MKKGISVFLVGSAIALFGTAVGAQNWPSIHGPEDTPKYPAAGSTYVPLTSWVYPAVEKLAAMRYIRSDFRGTRPWSRTECARLTDEAADRIADDVRAGKDVPEFVAETLKELQSEFERELDVIGGEENRSLQMESVYTRVMSISGPMLDDSYHFGQTISNDFGRPDRRGTNVIAGASARATFGPFFAYVDQEYEHAPSEPAYPAAVQQTVLNMDQGQAFLPHGGPAINRLQSMDTYAGVNLKNWQISFGRQSLWWGTSESGGLLLSDNAPPINGLHIDRTVPFRLPWIFGFLGPMHVSFVAGKLGGHLNSPVNCPPSVPTCGMAPWFQNTRITFKMTDRVEFGVSHAAIFGGQGFRNGASIFLKAFFPVDRLANQANSTFDNKQYMSWDFNARLNRATTWYTELLGSDDPYPLSQVSRTAIDSGLYISRLPLTHDKIDLRFEGVYTASPFNQPPGKLNEGFLHYFAVRWAGGYTNDGFIMGNSVGRDARRYGGQLTYHLSPRSMVQLEVAHTQVSAEFIPGGANWTNYRINFSQYARSGLYVLSAAQAEHLNIPVLYPAPTNNFMLSVEVGYAFHGR